MTAWMDTEHKEWYTIRAPESFGGNELGTTIASEDDELVGQRIRTSLSEAATTTPARNGRVSFSISSIREDDAWTELVSYELPQNYRKTVLDDGGILIPFENAVSGDGHKLEGELLLEDPTLDTEKVQESVVEALSEYSMKEVANALVNGSLPVIDDDNKEGHALEINSLSVITSEDES